MSVIYWYLLLKIYSHQESEIFTYYNLFNKYYCLFQSNANHASSQVQHEIDLHRSQIVLLRCIRRELQREPESPHIQQRIITIENQIAEHESKLQLINHTWNGSH